jgi:hypothetical protein
MLSQCVHADGADIFFRQLPCQFENAWALHQGHHGHVEIHVALDADSQFQRHQGVESHQGEALFRVESIERSAQDAGDVLGQTPAQKLRAQPFRRVLEQILEAAAACLDFAGPGRPPDQVAPDRRMDIVRDRANLVPIEVDDAHLRQLALHEKPAQDSQCLHRSDQPRAATGEPCGQLRVAGHVADLADRAPVQGQCRQALRAAPSGQCIEEGIGGSVVRLTRVADDRRERRIQQEALQRIAQGQPMQVPGAKHLRRQHAPHSFGVQVENAGVVEHHCRVDHATQRR